MKILRARIVVPLDRSPIENGAVERHIAFGAGTIEKGSPSDLPLANSAIARRSAVELGNIAASVPFLILTAI